MELTRLFGREERMMAKRQDELSGRGFGLGRFGRVQAWVASTLGRGRRASQGACAKIHAKLSDERGQGTTEYAILVGVLVVIAIIAITVFRPKLQELWDAISNGINGL